MWTESAENEIHLLLSEDYSTTEGNLNVNKYNNLGVQNK